MHHSIAIVSVLCLSVGAGADTTLQAVQIIGTGDPAPGLPGLLIGGGGANISVNEMNHVATYATLTGAGVTASNNIVLIAGDPTNLVPVAREGSQVPGADPGAVYWPTLNVVPFSQPVLSDLGLIAFHALIFQNSTTGEGIISGTPASVSSLVHRTMASDSPTGLEYDLVRSGYGMMNSGAVVFCGTLDPGNLAGIWSKSIGTTNRYAFVGDPAIGGGGVTYAPSLSTWGESVVVNNLGEAAFGARVEGPGITTSNDTLILAGTPSGYTIVAREGNAAPGTGRTYSNLGDADVSLRVNDAGAIAFNARLSSGRAIMAGAFNTLTTYALTGGQVPTLAPGITFLSFGNPELDGNGFVYFYGQFAGPGVTASNDSALFRWAGAGVEILYREGDAAPVSGFPGDAVFGHFANNGRLELNNRGDVVFAATLTGTGLSGFTGLYYRTASGELLNLVTQGKVIVPINGTAFNPSGSTASNGIPVGQPATGGSPECGRPHSLNERGIFGLRIRVNGTGNERWLLMVPTTCQGDADLSGAVDIGDLNQVIGNFGNTGGPGIPGDTNLDGSVDINDLNQVLGNFGSGCN